MVPRSRGGSNKDVNLAPVEPKRHDRYHTMTGNALPTEVLRLLATDTVGYGRNRTIEPHQLETLYQIATMMDWPTLYKPGTVVPSGTVESLARHPRTLFRHATAHQVEELYHLNCAVDGLEHDRGYGWQKTRILQQACHFFETPDDPLDAMWMLLTDVHEGQYTWVGALQTDTREALQQTIQESELVPLTRGASIELRGIIATQRAHIARHYQQWMRTYEAHYGQKKRKKRPETARRSPRRGR